MTRISSVSSVSSRSLTPVRRHRSRTRSPAYSSSQRASPPKSVTEPTPQPEKEIEPEPEPEPEMELELATTPPPVEDVLAKRRAQRQAILAKFKAVENGVTSADIGTPGGTCSSSTALPPPPSAPNSISDIPIPQTKPTSEAPAPVQTSPVSPELGQYFPCID